VLDNPLISEIVIADDFSDEVVYDELRNLIGSLNNPKIKLLRNHKNLGPLMNKYFVVTKAKCDWCIMLDSDNIIDNTYVEKIHALTKKEDTIYCPEILYKEGKEVINFDYRQFIGLTVDKYVAKRNIKNKFFECWLNTGNFFFNKYRYMKAIEENVLDFELGTSDSVYFNYLWLIHGGRLQLVPGLNYVHRIHKGSWYKNNLVKCNKATIAIKKMIETA
jgi:glycosyltransferase involved in cell wall biosynthesis